jgi:hypothetical protein
MNTKRRITEYQHEENLARLQQLESEGYKFTFTDSGYRVDGPYGLIATGDSIYQPLDQHREVNFRDNVASALNHTKILSDEFIKKILNPRCGPPPFDARTGLEIVPYQQSEELLQIILTKPFDPYAGIKYILDRPIENTEEAAGSMDPAKKAAIDAISKALPQIYSP